MDRRFGSASPGGYPPSLPLSDLGMGALLGGQERSPFASPLFLPDWVGNRGGQQQPLGVGIARVRRDLVSVAVFDNLAVVHHGDPVADIPDHGQIVRYEQEIG